MPDSRSSNAGAISQLWRAYAISLAGSNVSFGLLPLLAITELDAGAPTVSLLAAATGLCAGIVSLAVAPRLERAPKRAVLLICEIAQAVTMAALLVAAIMDILTLVQIFATSMVEASLFILYLAATNATIKEIADERDFLKVCSRMESAGWTAMAVGPPLGGLLVTMFGPSISLTIDAASYVLAAILLRRLPRAHQGCDGGAPKSRTRKADGRDERPRALDGFKFIVSVPTLRLLFLNAMTFGGAIMMVAPLLAVLMLKDLHLTPFQYGVALGLPSVGGLLGAVLASRLEQRMGRNRLLLVSGVLRSPWILLLPLAPEGAVGLTLIVTSQFMTMIGAGSFNTVFAATRLSATPQRLVIRVTTAWSVAAKAVQPAMIAIGGILAAITSLRFAMILGGVLAALSIILLPWPKWTTDSQEPADS